MLMFSLACEASGKAVKNIEPVQTGRASWYRGKGKSDVPTGPPHFAFRTYVRVTNLKNNKSIIVKITDRGPFVRGRIIDVNRKAARELDIMQIRDSQSPP